MGIFSRLSKKANGALDRATSPAKELDIAIAELEEHRTKALAELVSYKATAKQMDNDIERYTTKAAEWEKRAMMAVRAGDDEAARTALREQKNCAVEASKIKRDRDEATGYAVQLNKSRKQFEVKLTTLKLRKNTYATQLAAARAGGDAFGHDSSVWDRFAAAEERIDDEAVAAEVDAAVRGDDAEAQAFDAKLLAATDASGVALLGSGEAAADVALEELKARVTADRAARQRALGSGGPATSPRKSSDDKS